MGREFGAARYLRPFAQISQPYVTMQCPDAPVRETTVEGSANISRQLTILSLFPSRFGASNSIISMFEARIPKYEERVVFIAYWKSATRRQRTGIASCISSYTKVCSFRSSCMIDLGWINHQHIYQSMLNGTEQLCKYTIPLLLSLLRVATILDAHDPCCSGAHPEILFI